MKITFRTANGEVIGWYEGEAEPLRDAAKTAGMIAGEASLDSRGLEAVDGCYYAPGGKKHHEDPGIYYVTIQGALNYKRAKRFCLGIFGVY